MQTLYRPRILPRRLARTRIAGMETAESLEGQVGIEAPWAYLWTPLPNGDYDLAWIYFDRYPLAIYVAARRGSVERGNWVAPPKLPSEFFGSGGRKEVDAVDLRGEAKVERGAGYVAARTPNGHVLSVTVNVPGYGPTLNVQGGGTGPYGGSIGSSLQQLVSAAYPGITTLGALPPVPTLGMFGL